jgi:hypothetical protein
MHKYPEQGTDRRNAISESLDYDHNNVRELAYQLWVLRARPAGSPEVDWYRAEYEFKNIPRL